MGSKGGGGSQSSGMNFGVSNSEYRPNPEAMAAYRRALGMAENVTSQPFQPYQGQMVAGFTPDQMNAMQGIRNMQNIAQPYINAATNLTNQAVNYSDPRNFNAQTMQQYQNPYQQQVVDATMKNLAQLNAQQEQQGRSAAAQRGTFGGSGEFLGRAEIARQQGLANAQTLAGLQQQGYQQAIGQYNQQQQQAIQTAQNAAYGLGQLGQSAQNAALTGIQALMGSGAQQQALQQQQLTGAYNQFLQQQAFPYQQAAFYSGIAGGIAPNMGGTTTTQSFGMNQNQQQQQGGGGGGAMGGLSSIMSMLPAMFSDRDDKTDIKKLGKDPESGEQLYAYRYKDDPKSYPKVVGPMAQDVEKHSPENVSEVNGHKIVKGFDREHFADGGTGTGTGTGLGTAAGTNAGSTPGQKAASIYDVPSADTSASTAGLGGLSGNAGTGQGLDPGVSSFVQNIFDPKTADQMARAKWVNQPTEEGGTPYTGDNYVIPPSLMNDGSSAYPYNPQPGTPMASGGRAERAPGGGLGSFMDLVKKGGASGPFAEAPDNYIADAQQVGIGKIIPQGKDIAKGITESAAASGLKGVMKDAPSGGGGGGGGGAPKMPDMKGAKGAGKKPEGEPFKDPGANTPPASGDTTVPQQSPTGTPQANPVGSPDVSAANQAAGQGGFDFGQAAGPIANQSPVVDQMSAQPPMDMAPAQIPEIPLLGFGFNQGGRVHKDGGGGAGASAPSGGGFGVLGQPGKGIGDIVLGDAQSPGDLAGIGDIMAGQEKATGENLLGKWNKQVWANDPGEQQTPEQQGMPSMPKADFYTTPRKDLPSVLQTEHYGEQNPNPVFGYMMMGGMGGKGGGLGPIGGMGLAGQINQQQDAANAQAKQAELKATRESMLKDPANFPVQGYFTKIADQRINPRTGLFNVDYTGAYRGYPFKDGGRVGRDSGGKLGLGNISKEYVDPVVSPETQRANEMRDVDRYFSGKRPEYDLESLKNIDPRMKMAGGGSLSPAEEAAIEQRMNQIIRAESRGDPRAQNRLSSAGGLGQFIDSTWLKTARQTNPALRSVPDRQVLAMKKDASPEGVQFQKDVLRTFTRDNAMRLKAEGLPITPQNLYSVHFSGGTQIAKASPNTPMSAILGDAARRANPTIARLTVGQFNDKMTRHMGAGQTPTQYAANDARAAKPAEVARAVPYDPSKPSLAFNAMPQRTSIPMVKPAPGFTPASAAPKQVAAADVAPPPASKYPGSALNRINPADPSGPLLGSPPTSRAPEVADTGSRKVAGAPLTGDTDTDFKSAYLKSIENAGAPKVETPKRGFIEKLAREFSPVSSAQAADRGVYPSASVPQKMTDREVMEAVGRGEKINYDAAGNAVRNVPSQEPTVAPRIEKGVAPSGGDHPTWNPNASTPAQSAEGIPTIDKGEAGPTDVRPGFHMPEYTYAPGVQEQAGPLTDFGGSARQGVTDTNLLPGSDQYKTGFDFPQTVVPMGGNNATGPEAPAVETAAGPKEAPAEQTPAQETAAASGQKYWGDWRDAAPWKDDPIGGAFDALSGETPQADKPGTWEPGESAGLDFGGLDLGFAKGGLVRKHFEDGGEADDSDPLSAIGQGLGSIGEGLGSAVNEIGQGFGSLLSGGEQPRETASAAAQPEGQDFFTRWSENPLSQFLYHAGQAMSAHPNAHPLETIAAGMPGAITAGRAGSERAEKEAKVAAANAYQQKLEGAGRGEEVEAPAETEAPEGTEAPAEGEEGAALPEAAPVGGGEVVAPRQAAAAPRQAAPQKSQIDRLYERYNAIADMPATGAQIAQKTAAMNNVYKQIQLMEHREAANKGTIATTTDQWGQPVMYWKSGPKQGQIFHPEEGMPGAPSAAGAPAPGGAGQVESVGTDWSKSGDEFLKTLPVDVQEQVRQIAEGRADMPKGKYAQTLLKAVTHYQPGFDASVYNARRKMRTDYADNSGTKPGAQITAGNTAIGHAGELSDLILKLNNYDIDLLNKPINWVKEHYGDKAAETLNKYRSLTDKYVDEQTSFYKGRGGGGIEERKEARERLDPNKAPKVLLETLRGDQEAMGSKISELEENWHRTMGKGQTIPIDDYGVISKHGKEGQALLQHNLKVARGEAKPVRTGRTKDGQRVTKFSDGYIKYGE